MWLGCLDFLLLIKWKRVLYLIKGILKMFKIEILKIFSYYLIDGF